MRAFPFLSLHTTLILLRIAVALIFITHAVVRVANETVDRFGSFLESKGLPFGTATVWCLSAFEIVGGVLLALGYYKKWLSAGFILILLVGIVLIHATLGWFVGELGSGGSEYSFILIVALLVIAAGDEKGKTK